MILNRYVWGKSVARGRVFLAVALLMAGAVALSVVPQGPAAGNFSQVAAPILPLTAAQPSQRVHAGYGQLPLSFEPNLGQSDPQVKFLARGSKYGLFLTNQAAVLKLVRSSSALQMSLAGSNPNAEVAGTETLPGKSNYLIGNDRSRWHLGVPQFARVRYSQVYPGVDLVYYGKQGQLEYDFEIAPGADPAQVALQFQGADKLSLDHDGNLVVAVSGGDLRLEAPRVYQTVGAEQKTIDGKFVLQSDLRVGFEIGAYDRSRALVIDPVLSYSTYLGGNGAETSPSIAVDAALNAYVAGTTTSANFPIVAAPAPTPIGAFQSCLDDSTQPQPTTCPGGTATDVFIAKLDPSGTVLLFSTFLGGSGNDSSAGIAIDSGFNIIVAGTTTSTDFPVANAFQAAPGPSAMGHVFVSQIDGNGQHLTYSTYLRGGVSESATGVAVDKRNRIFVTGTTASTDFPTTPDAFQPASKAANQFFLSEINPGTTSTASLVYSTYFGGGNPSNGVVMGGGVAVDASNNVYITGATNYLHTGGNPALDFPILNAPQNCLNAPTNPSPCPTPSGILNTDAFVAKFNPSAAIGSHLIYSTYIGGSGTDAGTGISVDTGGFAYITGTTNSTDIVIPTTTIPFQQCLGQGTATNPVAPATCPVVSNNDAFVAKLNTFTTGSTTTPVANLVYFSYLGGSGDDHGLAIAADASSGAHITGTTTSGDFAIINPLVNHGTFSGGKDAFVSLIDTVATTQNAATDNSSFLGGGSDDQGTGIAVDTNNSTYVVGDTTSGDFPTANALQGAMGGGGDAFVSKIGFKTNFSMTAVASPIPAAGVGSPVTFTFNITNNGDYVPTATFVNNLPTTGTLTTAPGNCAPVAGTSVTCTVALTKSAATPIVFTLTPASNVGQTPYSFGDSGSIIAPGTATASANVTVNDYTLALTPNSATVVAGSPASYTAQVTPTGSIPSSISLSCSGLPGGATCSVPNGAITSLTTGPQSRVVVVNTTVRTTTTAELHKHGLVYAVWFPVSGLAFLGLGIGGTMSRKRRALLGLLIGAFFVLTFLQAGCGSKSAGTTTTTGTIAGKYTFVVTATSGIVSHSQSALLEVK